MATDPRTPGGEDRFGVAARDLHTFLDGVGASEAHTIAIRLLPVKTKSARAFVDWLETQVPSDEHWSLITTRSDEGEVAAYALPVASAESGLEASTRIPFIEVHTLMVAWWLTVAWRTSQLLTATEELRQRKQTISSAVCARAMVETAAAAWVDGRKMTAGWADVKRHGPPKHDPDAAARRARLMATLNEVLLGAKFDDRAPSLKATFGRVQRSNVLGSVEKLAKVAGTGFQDDYQWLCNTVHPSLGNAFAFSSPWLRHETGTHVLTWFANGALTLIGPEGATEERSVQDAIERAAYRSAVVLRGTLDAALALVDDVGLTTGAGSLSTQQYWRAFRSVDPQGPCPCRSGKRVYRCGHQWGDTPPDFPDEFPTLSP